MISLWVAPLQFYTHYLPVRGLCRVFVLLWETAVISPPSASSLTAWERASFWSTGGRGTSSPQTNPQRNLPLFSCHTEHITTLWKWLPPHQSWSHKHGAVYNRRYSEYRYSGFSSSTVDLSRSRLTHSGLQLMVVSSCCIIHRPEEALTDSRSSAEATDLRSAPCSQQLHILAG